MCIAIIECCQLICLIFMYVYIASISAGGRNLLITQLFILPVCIYVVILCYTCICHMLSTCMFAYHVCVLYVFVLEAR